VYGCTAGPWPSYSYGLVLNFWHCQSWELCSRASDDVMCVVCSLSEIMLTYAVSFQSLRSVCVLRWRESRRWSRRSKRPRKALWRTENGEFSVLHSAAVGGRFSQFRLLATWTLTPVCWCWCSCLCEICVEQFASWTLPEHVVNCILEAYENISAPNSHLLQDRIYSDL